MSKRIKPSDLLARAQEILRENHAGEARFRVGCCGALQEAGKAFGFANWSLQMLGAQQYLYLQRPDAAGEGLYWFGHPVEHPNTAKRLACLKRAEEAAKKDGN